MYWSDIRETTWFSMVSSSPSAEETIALKVHSEKRDLINPARIQSSRMKPEPNRDDGASTKADLDSDPMSKVLKLLRDRQVDQAERVLLKMLDHDHTRLGALIELAMIEVYDRKQPEMGLKYLLEAAKHDPKNEALMNEITKTYVLLGRVDEGLAFFRNLIGTYPQYKWLNLNLARLLYEKEDFQAAFSLLNFSKDGRFIQYRAMVLKGKIHVELGNDQAAREDFEEAVDGYEREIRRRLVDDLGIIVLVEELDDLLFRLTRVLLKLENYEEAHQIVSKISERMPSDPRVISIMEEIYKTHDTSSM